MQKLYILISFILHFIFVSSRSISNSKAECKSEFKSHFNKLCTPFFMLDSNIPCYSNTTFNYDNFIIEQVKDDSLDLIAEYCCSSSEYCNLASISTEMCCTGKHCTKQCYGVNWPLTDTTVTDLNNLNVVKNRGMKPPKSLFNAVFNETS